MRKVIKKVKFVALALALFAVAGFLNDNGIINLGFLSNTVYAETTLTSDDGLWNFTESGEIGNYLGSETVVTIPEQLTSNSVTYNITKIPWNALSWNNNITQINIGSNITYIANSPFADMTSLKDIKVSSGNANYCDINGILYNKGKSKLMRFPQMNSTEVLELPDTFIECNINALEKCSNVYMLKIPASYRGKASSAGDILTYKSFPNLKNIEVSQGNVNYSSQDGVLYNYDKSMLVWYPAKRFATDFTFPDSVKSIANNAFENATNLENVNLTSNIDTIKSCFSGCKLTSINHIKTREEYINWDTSIKSVFQNNLNVFERQPFLKSLVEQEAQYAFDNYIQAGMNDYQKIKALYNYVTNKVSYITSGSISDSKNHCISSIFLGDSTVCEGYTLGMSLLLDKAGITNCPVSGGNHAWNLVYINDTWLQIDATWDDEGDQAGTSYFLKTAKEYTELGHPKYNYLCNSNFTDYSYGKDKNIYAKVLPKCDGIIGDINKDGILNQQDLLSMQNEIRSYSMYWQEGYYNVLADMNRDGKINSDDYNLLNDLVY